MKTKSKTLPECDDGPEAFKRFDDAMTKLLTVSKATLMRREREYQKRRADLPNRPGPKPKATKKTSSRASRARG